MSRNHLTVLLVLGLGACVAERPGSGGPGFTPTDDSQGVPETGGGSGSDDTGGGSGVYDADRRNGQDLATGGEETLPVSDEGQGPGPDLAPVGTGIQCSPCATSSECSPGLECVPPGQICKSAADVGKAVCPADCVNSLFCKTAGQCSPSGGVCVVASDADCALSSACKDGGACKAEGGKCVVPPEPGPCDGITITKPLPSWKAQDIQPKSPGYKKTYGLEAFACKRIAIVLVQGQCGSCRAQVEIMEKIRVQLEAKGKNDFVMIAANRTGYTSASLQQDITSRCSFPVFQDTSSAQIWTKHGGKKNDAWVYDKDGQQLLFFNGSAAPAVNITDFQNKIYAALNK
jgi:hypothetical protein